jgi:hypothetical protein
LVKCYFEQVPQAAPPLFLPGLKVFCLPGEGRKYVIGADPAEDSPTSDDSVAIVVEADTGEEAATLAGKIEPSVFATYITQLSGFYGGAPVLVERNNHGHAVLVCLRGQVRCLCGLDQKSGWLTNAVSKARMFSDLVDVVREENCVVHNLETFQQLASVEGSTLRAPKGEHDDYAMAFAMATVARGKTSAREVWVPPSIPIAQHRASFGFEPTAEQTGSGLPVCPPERTQQRRRRRLWR